MTARSLLSYQHSTAHAKLRERQRAHQTLRLAFVDIDATMVGTPAEQRRARQLLELRGYVVCFVTSRTSEVMLTWAERRRSDAFVRARPLAKLVSAGGANGPLEPADPVQLPQLTGLLNADIIAASTGPELLLRQRRGGYRHDRVWWQGIQQQVGNMQQWRQQVQHLIGEYNLQIMERRPDAMALWTAPMDDPAHYRAGQVDVWPPRYRLQVYFRDLKTKLSWQRWLKRLGPKTAPIAWVEESTPAAGIFSLYLLPAFINKQTVCDRIISQLSEAIGGSPNQFEVLFCGDSMSDLPMGLYAGRPLPAATFLVVGGSRLKPLFSTKRPLVFAGQSLQNIQQALHLTKHRPGWYTFKQGQNVRAVICGDQAWPGTIGPQSIIAFLQQIP